jgi:predicted TIM-barrel fold metal-dependent hydrolase
VAIFKRSIETGLRRCGDSYYHPIYEAAQDLDMTICVHKSGMYTGFGPAFAQTRNGGAKYTLYVQDALVSLLWSGTVAKFPNLRFGFIEAGSGWVPHGLFEASFDPATRSGAHHEPGTHEALARFQGALEGTELYVTCETSEDLPYLIGQLGDDNFVIGTDYGHSDRSALILAHRELEAMDELSDVSKKKITDLNGRRLYGLK